MWPSAVSQENTSLGLCIPLSRKDKGKGGVRQRFPFSLRAEPLSHSVVETWAPENCSDLRTYERTLGPTYLGSVCAEGDAGWGRVRSWRSGAPRGWGEAGGGEGSPSGPTPAPRPCARTPSAQSFSSLSPSATKKICPEGRARRMALRPTP